MTIPSDSLKVGAKVRFWSGAKEGDGSIGEIKHDGTYMVCGTPVAYIRSIGAVALTHIEPEKAE